MIEEIKFKHRETGCIETEKVYGENWLSLIYGSPLGKLPLWVAIQRAWFSKWYGRKMDSIKSKNKISELIFIPEYISDKKISIFLSACDFLAIDYRKEPANPGTPIRRRASRRAICAHRERR